MAKWLLLGAAVMSLAATDQVTSYAAAIDKIKIRLQTDGFDEGELPILDAESMDDAYVITGIERLYYDEEYGPAKKNAQAKDDDQENVNQEDDGQIKNDTVQVKKNSQSKDEMEDTVTELSYEIEVESGDGDTFCVLSQDDIKFSGLSATCSKAVRKDNAQKLLLTIELKDTGELIGKIGKAYWDGNQTGRWEKAPGASAYLVMLYHNEKRIGHPHRTCGDHYDFSPLMKKAGMYHFKVFPLTKQGKKGKPFESSWKNITDSEADKNEIMWSGKIPGWQSDGEIPSYILQDGTYPQMDSLLIGDEWYQFDEKGGSES